MVGIVILNYNNAVDTLNCIKSIYKYNTYPIKTVIVDNGSTQRNIVNQIDSYLLNQFSEKYIKIEEGTTLKELKEISLYISLKNDGYAKGNNKGIELLYRDPEVKYILILNSDILFVEDIIGNLVNDLQSTENAAIVCPILYKKNLYDIDYNCARRAISLSELFLEYMFLFYDFFYILSKHRKKRNLLIDKKLPLSDPLLEIELPSGSCMLLEKEFFKKIGFFDPNTFLYNEENILWEKIKKTGKKNFLDTRLKCIHLGATTISNKISSSFILNCSIESNHYFLKEYTNANWLYLFCMEVFYSLMKLKLKLKQIFKYKI